MFKNHKKNLAMFICFFLAFIIFNIYRSYHGIKVTTYSYCSEKISESVKAIIIADLHDHVFGRDNDELIEKITAQQPDCIFMVGDMLNGDSENTQKIVYLIKQLKNIAPIYYAWGNHELIWQENHGENLQKQIESAGAIVVNENWCDIEINGQEIRVGGLYEWAYGYDEKIDYDVSDVRLRVSQFLTEYQDTESLKIMLAHRPEAFACSSAARNYDIDLVISGHLHGGQVVLPLLGGIYATEQGWFPEYVHGMYEKDNMNILITSGLSTNKKMVPRWNNPPEIMVLELS